MINRADSCYSLPRKSLRSRERTLAPISQYPDIRRQQVVGDSKERPDERIGSHVLCLSISYGHVDRQRSTYSIGKTAFAGEYRSSHRTMFSTLRVASVGHVHR